jgi:hypothetical protein
MSFMTCNPRFADMMAERSCVLWRLSREAYEKLEDQRPATARLLRVTFLRIAGEQQDALVVRPRLPSFRCSAPDLAHRVTSFIRCDHHVVSPYHLLDRLPHLYLYFA